MEKAYSPRRVTYAEEEFLVQAAGQAAAVFNPPTRTVCFHDQGPK